MNIGRFSHALVLQIAVLVLGMQPRLARAANCTPLWYLEVVDLGHCVPNPETPNSMVMQPVVAKSCDTNEVISTGPGGCPNVGCDCNKAYPSDGCTWDCTRAMTACESSLQFPKSSGDPLNPPWFIGCSDLCEPPTKADCPPPDKQPQAQPQVCNSLDNNCDGLLDAEGDACQKSANPPRCDPCDYSCENSEDVAADPINIKTGKSFVRDADLVIRTAMGEVNLYHAYVSDDASWTLEGTQDDGSGLLQNVPKPFGPSPYNEGSLRWWHNYFSFVLEAKTSQPALFVRDTDGHFVVYKGAFDLGTGKFDACNGVDPAHSLDRCFATPATGGEFPEEMLEVDQQTQGQHKYVLWKKTGGRLEFSKAWLSRDADLYFLESIYNAQGELLAKVEYQSPEGMLSCERGKKPPPTNCYWDSGKGDPTFSCTSGAPFVSRVTAANGAVMEFQYEILPYAVPPLYALEHKDWVLKEVDLKPPDGVSVWAVKYIYRNNAAGAEAAGEIAAIETRSLSTGSPRQVTRFAYPSKGSKILRVTRETDRGSFVVSEHQYESEEPNSPVSGASSAAEVIKVEADPAGGLKTTDQFGYDGFGATATFSQMRMVSKFPGQLDGALTDVTDSCDPSQACSQGTVHQSRDLETGWVREVTDKGGHTTRYDYEKQLDWIYERAVTTSYPGSSNPPVPETTTYLYDSDNKKYHWVDRKTRGTVLAGQLGPGVIKGDLAGVHYRYDEQGRVTAEIHSGATATGLGTVGLRYVGTFFSYLPPGGMDLGQKFLEVHGPCEVASSNAINCAMGSPVTQTVYFAKNDTAGRKNQPKEVRRYLDGTASGAPPLVTKYDDYDLLGNLLQETDENGHAITYGYLPGTHLLSRKTVAIDDGSGTKATTEYGYDFGHRVWTKYPAPSAGDSAYEVECYREGTGGDGCTLGTPTDILQWRAKAGDPLGADWSEKVVYTYWQDPYGIAKQSLQSEAYYSPSGLRRVKKYGADLQRRPVREAAGGPLSDPLVAELQTVRAYDHAGRIKSLGLPFNDPPKYCESPNGSPSTACSALAYDDVDRLESVTEHPDASTSTTTCFGRDGNGNITTIAFDCSADQFELKGRALCQACLEDSPSTKTATYVYDDFGNVITASLPNTGTASAKGALRFVYDVRGQVTKRDFPSLRERGIFYETAYDGLGRALSLTSKSSSTGGSEIGLWMARYDSASVPPCTGTQNALGRLAQRSDSFGTTCYSYDAEGRILKEERHRANPTCDNKCVNDTLTTEYAYDPSGNLTSIKYPHGRVVWYDYYTEKGLQNRVKGLRVNLPGSGEQGREILRNAEWEPYGSLKGYSVVNPDDDSEAKVEYLLGDAGNQDPAATQSCGYGRPAANDNSGRLRALWVSKAGAGDLYRRAYSWKADQIVGLDTCVGSADSAVPAFRERFDYDHALRLTQVDAAGVGKRSYAYDARGNRKSEESFARTWAGTLGGDAAPDQLASVAAPAAAGESWQLKYSYDYDADGRVKAMHAPPYLTPGSFGSTDVKMEFGYGDASKGGIDAVFTAVTLSNGFDGGAVYNYYYDAQGRRWMKMYPTLKVDEFFYDSGHLLLEDRGNDALDSATPVYPIDEYVWLGGRPVAFVRSNFDAGWNRQGDLQGSCKRNGEEAACGLYYLVTDHIGKPAVALDSRHRIAGAAVEGDPFGEANSRPLAGDTRHPSTGGESRTLATIDLGPGRGLARQVRVKFAMVDTAGVDDGVRFVDSGSAELSGQRIGGVHRGPVWSDWIDVPEGDGRVVAALEPGAGGHEATTGASMESLQFRVRGAGAGQAWPPIRFPGQYADAETGLNENWHRYYEPSTGRYAQAEPVLSAPTTVMATTSSGLGWSAYGYATNNPVGLGDPNGMLPMDSPGWDRVATANLKIVAAAQAGDKPSQYFVAAAVGLFAGVNFYALSWLVPEMLAGGAAGASVAVADAMKLPAAAPGTDTIVLGQYASRVAGGIFPAKERLLQPLADAVRGRLLDQLAGEIEVLTPHIRAADRILFCVKDKMGPLTMAEYQLIKSSPELLMKTIFVTGGYPPK